MKQSLKPSIYWLLLFVPVTIGLDQFGSIPAPVVFFSAALAIIPIASLIVRATEQVATRTGDAVGGLLNATFGNAPELIIGIVALRAGLFDMVRAAIVGGVLANLLLALGVAFLLGGLRHHDQSYNAGVARMYSSMMLIAVISLATPSAFTRFFAGVVPAREIERINLGTALVLLCAYVLYLVFMLKTHPEFFSSSEGGEPHQDHGPRWSLGRAIGSLVVSSVLAAWMSEILVGAAEGTGEALGMSPIFIGIVFLAVIGGAAESGSAIAMALRNKMDLTIGISLGSSIQIALFIAPLLVLLSYVFAPAPLVLSFNRSELGSVFLGVLIGSLVSGDGRSNWFKGVQLITVYLMIALMFYFVPEVVP